MDIMLIVKKLLWVDEKVLYIFFFMKWLFVYCLFFSLDVYFIGKIKVIEIDKIKMYINVFVVI